MSHVSALSPGLRRSLLETTALVAPVAPEPPAKTKTRAKAAAETIREALPLVSFPMSGLVLDERIERGTQAARNLIADPRPYKIDTAQLQRMVDAFAALASSATANAITIPAEMYSLLDECRTAERARCHRRGEAWAVAETIEAKAGKFAFAFSQTMGNF